MPHDTLHMLRSMLYLLEHTSHPVFEDQIIRKLCQEVRAAVSSLSELENQSLAGRSVALEDLTPRSPG